MKLNYFILSFFLCISYGNSNEQIIKLNELYFNNVLDLSSYKKSITKIGVDINSNDFISLFELFETGVLDIGSYNQALEKIIINRDQTKENNIVEDLISNDKIFKTYKHKKCQGSSQICKLFAFDSVDLYMENGSIYVSKDFEKWLVDNDPDVEKVTKQIFHDKGNKFYTTIKVLLVGGKKAEGNFRGTLQKNDFELTLLDIKSRGVTKATIYFE